MAYGLFAPQATHQKLGWLDNPKNIGLLSAALGILANNKGNYGAFAPALGAGGLLGLQSALQTQQQNILNRRNESRDVRSDYFNREQLGLLKKEFGLKEADTRLFSQSEYGRSPTIQSSQTQVSPAPLGQNPFTQQILQQPYSEGGFQSQLASTGQATAPAVETIAGTNAAQALEYRAKSKMLFERAQRNAPFGSNAKVKAMMDADMTASKHFADQADKIEAKMEKAPTTKMVSIGHDMEVEHQWNPTKGEWEPIPGSKPRHVFSQTPLVRMTMNQEGAEAAAVGKGFAENYNDIQKAGFNANSKINNIKRMNQLLEGVETGKLTPLGTELAAYAQSAGFNVDPKLGNKQAAEALANEVALQLRNPSGGAGMPGALSDTDRNFLISMAPGIGKTPEGRKLISETTIKLAKRDQDVAKLAREYRKTNGHMDEGFYDVLSAFSAKNPLFEEKYAPAPVTGGGWTPEKERRLQELRQRAK